MYEHDATGTPQRNPSRTPIGVLLENRDNDDTERMSR
jgi:hypothetical protein